MTAAELVSAFSLPGSEADRRFRETVEGRADLELTRADVASFGRALQTRLGWEAQLVEEAVSQVLRVCTLRS